MTPIFLSPEPVRMMSTVPDSSSPGSVGGGTAGRGGRSRHGGRGDAELLLERLDALRELEH